MMKLRSAPWPLLHAWPTALQEPLAGPSMHSTTGCVRRPRYSKLHWPWSLSVSPVLKAGKAWMPSCKSAHPTSRMTPYFEPFSTLNMTQERPTVTQEQISDVHNRLFFRLFQAANSLQRQAIKELGITTVQWAVLGALTRPQAEQGMTFGELADYILVSRQNLDGIIKRLEREGYVKRIPHNTDKRVR